MKLFKLNSLKEYAFIGEDEKSARWYLIDEHVKKFLEAIPILSEVSIKFETKEDKKDHLTYIQIATGRTESAKAITEPDVINKVETLKAVQCSCCNNKSLGAANMTAGALIALQGQVTLENINSEMTKLFNNAKSLIG